MRRPIMTVALMVTAFGGGFALLSLRGRDVTHETPGRVVQVGYAVAEQEKAATPPSEVLPPTPPSDPIGLPPTSPAETPAPTDPVRPPDAPAASPFDPPSTNSQSPPAAEPVAPPKAASEDPLQAVDSFIERNRTEANTAIEKLSEEAKELKERLAKVESALARWKKISQALDQQGAGNEAAAEPPLEAAPGEQIPPPVETVKELESEPKLELAPR
ncbi:hypothetical protein [Singulisphaera sp. PoT]|uniref:hypothetical protein n=1 Tax=Singulisphaera sp. PoT TaxID=3411797 RepID=UPI003BF58A5D